MRKAKAIVGCILCVAMFSARVFAADLDSAFLKRMLERHSPHPMLNIADRGASMLAPENTIPAIEKAFMLGADVVRVGVHLTKDEAIVVLQDHDLSRTTNVRSVFPNRRSAFVREFTLSEVGRLDAGGYFAREDPYGTIRSGAVSREEARLYASGSVKVPTLDEVVTLAKRYDAALDIEIRQLPGFYPKIGELVLDVVKRAGMEERVLISSLDHTLLYEMKKKNAKVDYAPVMLERLYLPGRYTRDNLGMRSLELAYDLLAVEFGYPKNEADFADALKRKVGMLVWGANDAETFPVLLRLGVAGAITQRPELLEAYLDRLFGDDEGRR